MSQDPLVKQANALLDRFKADDPSYISNAAQGGAATGIPFGIAGGVINHRLQQLKFDHMASQGMAQVGHHAGSDIFAPASAASKLKFKANPKQMLLAALLLGAVGSIPGAMVGTAATGVRRALD